jgi:hypothetical protein
MVSPSREADEPASERMRLGNETSTVWSRLVDRSNSTASAGISHRSDAAIPPRHRNPLIAPVRHLEGRAGKTVPSLIAGKQHVLNCCSESHVGINLEGRDRAAAQRQAHLVAELRPNDVDIACELYPRWTPDRQTAKSGEAISQYDPVRCVAKAGSIPLPQGSFTRTLNS